MAVVGNFYFSIFSINMRISRLWERIWKPVCWPNKIIEDMHVSTIHRPVAKYRYALRDPCCCIGPAWWEHDLSGRTGSSVRWSTSTWGTIFQVWISDTTRSFLVPTSLHGYYAICLPRIYAWPRAERHGPGMRDFVPSATGFNDDH